MNYTHLAKANYTKLPFSSKSNMTKYPYQRK